MRVTVANFHKDPMFPRIERVVADLLARGNVVTPVDVLIGMGLLRAEHLKDWRFGRVPNLERVINCNLSRLSRLLRILCFHAHNLNLKPSATAYMRYGKGPKRPLRFSKSGDVNLEAAYATHFMAGLSALPFCTRRARAGRGAERASIRPTPLRVYTGIAITYVLCVSPHLARQ